jgi:hypothetical protein
VPIAIHPWKYPGKDSQALLKRFNNHLAGHGQTTRQTGDRNLFDSTRFRHCAIKKCADLLEGFRHGQSG